METSSITTTEQVPLNPTSDGAKSVNMGNVYIRQTGPGSTFPDSCVNYASCYAAAIETASYSLYRGGSFTVTFKAQLSRDETR